jgi:hypothetical protein
MDMLFRVGGTLPDLEWEGWSLIAESLSVRGDVPDFRARQAVKLLLNSEEQHLEGNAVDWSAVEARLTAMMAGTITLTQLPDTVRCRSMQGWNKQEQVGDHL